MFGKRFHLPCAAILLCLFPLPGAWSLYAQENQYAAQKEAALIKALAAEFTRGKAVIADAWIEVMAASLVKTAGFPHAVKVELLEHPQPAWYALPDRVYVHSGAILRSGSEEDLRMQLAHQLAHARMRHGWEYAGQSASGPGVVWSILCPQSGNATLLPSALQGRVEQAEREAHRLASEWVAGQIPDPTGYVGMKERLAQKVQSHRHAHPPTLKRR